MLNLSRRRRYPGFMPPGTWSGRSNGAGSFYRRPETHGCALSPEPVPTSKRMRVHIYEGPSLGDRTGIVWRPCFR